MPFVVDASVAVCWLMPAIARDPALVPGLWWYELRNVLIVNEPWPPQP